MSRLSIIIPVFRNAGSLKPTYSTVTATLESQHPCVQPHFIFVNDGSDDGSLEELRELQEAVPNITVLSLSRNFGQAAAISAGLEEADGDVVVVMSADQQDPPEIMAQMIGLWREGGEVVIAYRQEREDSFLARVTSHLFYATVRLSYKNMPAGGFDYWLLDRKALDAFIQLKEHNPFFQGNILYLGFRTQFIPYRRIKRQVGRSQWGLGRKLKYSIDGILASSYLPVRWMSLTGLCTALLGFLYAGIIAVGWLVHRTPFQGWAPLMILILVIGGLIMLMLGIIGEYIWRIYDEVRNRPRFIVRDRFPSVPVGDR